MTAALLLALTAGMLGAVNPCGFALLPAYLSLLVAGASDTRGAVGRALTAAAGLTLGYVLVFGAFGLALAPLAGWLRPRLPWLTVALGVLLGRGRLAAGGGCPPRLVARAPRLTRSWPSMVLFGAAYAGVARLRHRAVPGHRGDQPPGRLDGGGGAVRAYALGMGLVVAVAALGVALRATGGRRLPRRPARAPVARGRATSPGTAGTATAGRRPPDSRPGCAAAEVPTR